MSCIYAVLFAFAPLLSVSGSMMYGDQSLLVQLIAHKTRGHIQTQGETCAALKHQGSWFSVPVCVGTPAQCFDVVADTGSDHVIVPSCICGETPGAGCAPSDKCFRGINNKSSTFRMAKNTRLMAITFGSGTIGARLAKDVVSVGDLKATMDDGVLLMTNRAGLKAAGPFEGILGLGMPKDKAALASMFQGLVHAGRHASGDKDQSDPLKEICSLMPDVCDVAEQLDETHPGGGDILEKLPEPKLFLEQARVDRFSMCYRGQTGALRLGVPPFSSPLQNIGILHWGLNFQGLSIGALSTSAPIETIFCGAETMKQGMETPCGILPDSGTTLLMGPQEQVSALEAGICSKWDRCQTRSNGKPSSEAFRQLLLECNDWLTEDKGILEIPSFFFHVKSGDGKLEAFELTAWAWVAETRTRDEDGSIKKVCASQIGPMEYVTPKNGPVWFFGQPLFLEYNVGFDMSTRQVSLRKEQCEPCSTEGGPVSLTDEGGRRWPRATHGEPRIPYYNVNMPL